MTISTTKFYIDPVHADFLDAFVQVLSEGGGIDGHFPASDGGVSLAGDVETGFTLVVRGLLDGAPRVQPDALAALVEEHAAFRAAWAPRAPLDDDPVHIGRVLGTLLEPGTHVIVRCHTAAGAHDFYSAALFHADGRSASETLPEMEARLRSRLGLHAPDAETVRVARAARSPRTAVPEVVVSKVGGMHAALSSATMQRENHTVNGQSFDMVLCPPGSCIPQRLMAGFPTDIVIKRAFAIAVFPVTQALWEAVMGENPSKFASDDLSSRRPVERVSWYEAIAFCNALSVAVGLSPVYRSEAKPFLPGFRRSDPDISCDTRADGFRLPSEAEWEYAARSGGDTYRYAGSDVADEVAWHASNSGAETHPVGGKAPTRWGIHDLSGNVAEWCWEVVFRGGSFREPAEKGSVPASYTVEVVSRGSGDRESRCHDVGFRLARTLPRRASS